MTPLASLQRLVDAACAYSAAVEDETLSKASQQAVRRELILSTKPFMTSKSAPSLAMAETIYKEYPRKVGKPSALRAIQRALKEIETEELLRLTKDYAKARSGQEQDLTPHASTWFNDKRFADDPSTWAPKPEKKRYERPLGGGY